MDRGHLFEMEPPRSHVECGEAVAGEPLFGGETPTYPWCRALIGDTRVFFGRDPIESITLTSYGR
jgi:hypothetical protein